MCCYRINTREPNVKNLFIPYWPHAPLSSLLCPLVNIFPSCSPYNLLSADVKLRGRRFRDEHVTYTLSLQGLSVLTPLDLHLMMCLVS